MEWVGESQRKLSLSTEGTGSEGLASTRSLPPIEPLRVGVNRLMATIAAARRTLRSVVRATGKQN
jgi:hypothetical protein